MNILQINIQSMSNKLLELDFVAHNDSAFIYINEHCLFNNEIDNVIIDNYILVSKYCRSDSIKEACV